MSTEGRPDDRPPDDELDQATVDRRWSQLVADFALPSQQPPHEQVVGLDPEPPEPAAPAPEPPPETTSVVVPWRQHLPADDDESAATEEHHYEPPEPPPLPRGDAASRFAWAGLLAGPVILFLAAVLGLGPSPWTALFGTAAFVGGFVTLVVRMRDERDGDDDGAVV